MDYGQLVKEFLKNVRDQKAKARVIELYDYRTRGFATDVELARRDYQLGLTDQTAEKSLFSKSYREENELRSYLGLEPLPAIDLTIL